MLQSQKQANGSNKHTISEYGPLSNKFKG